MFCALIIFFLFIFCCCNCMYINRLLNFYSFTLLERNPLNNPLFCFLKPSGFKYFHFLFKNYEIVRSRYKISDSRKNFLCENKNDDFNNHTEKVSEPIRVATSVTQIQTQLKIHNKIHCKPEKLLFLRYLLNKYKINL